MAANRIQLQDALQKPYNRVLFSQEVLNPIFGSEFKLNSSLIPALVPPSISESAVIDKVWIYGGIHLDDGTEVTCYEVLLQPKVRIEQSKVAIQQYVRKLLTAGQAALINFVAPANKNVWRLTLVAKDSVLTEKGVKEKTTNAKRYTFLLGPSETCKTAAERFETLSTEKEITFQALVNAFSVEKLSKAFFDEYTLHYQNFCDYLQESNYRRSVFNITFPADASKQDKDKASKPIRDFVKKLLGRIVFLYFLQKKGWLGASDTNYTDGRSDFIKQLFSQSGGNDTFYCTWLTVLFFDTLNKERVNDDFKMPNGKTVKVPFLNGGLFDKEEFDEHLLTFKSKLFHNPESEDVILTAKNNGFARGFLDFLEAFNFTIYEDSPDDHTVAVDPEMLGHIFENLLEDNKDKGAFYTPKEIVHYMCQESLIEYLATGLQNEYTVYRQIANEQIELFGNETRTGQLKLIEELGEKGLDREEVAHMVKNKDISKLTQKQLYSIDRLLDSVKICDPAIGSGAFPMGLLQEIFSIKELIAYETGKEWKPAETKLNIIQNSIYGVDIEKGAVDIARLRFWLSLVVDEEKPKPLPNLDYKIMVGDSLISKFDGEIVEIDWERKSSVGKADEYVKNVQRFLVEVADKQKKYFNPNNKNKEKLQTEIRNLKIELLINQLSFNKELYIGKTVQKGGFMPSASDIKHNTERELQIKSFDNLINKLKSLLKNSDEPFNHFDWKLDFPEVLNPYLVNGNGGFDIVIGNPPFGVKFSSDEKRLFRMLFPESQFKIDSYSLFTLKGIELCRLYGYLAYIIPSTLMDNYYEEKVRQKLLNEYRIDLIVELNDKVFSAATVHSMILGVDKRKTMNDYLIRSSSTKALASKFELIPKSFFLAQPQVSFSLRNFAFSSILKKLNFNSVPFNSVIDLRQAIKSGNDDLYICDEIKGPNYKPILGGKHIKRWQIEPPSLFINYGKHLACPRDYRIFEQPKILLREAGNKITATIDEDNFYIMSSLYNGILINQSFKIKYVLGLLNSEIFQFLMNLQTFSKTFGAFTKAKIFHYYQLPVKITDMKNQSIIELLVNWIIFLRTHNKDIEFSFFEGVLNSGIYQLYFPEEIKSAGKEILKHLGDLKPITDDMSEEEKLAIIQSEFERLHHPDHPVRLAIDTLDSVEEVRIIKEALK
ncbi:MAG: Eco57I restriction-modification methylase domain-containing protein [Bacteroidales bacterium]|jgi:adenine-specific DNA-methyltransferase